MKFASGPTTLTRKEHFYSLTFKRKQKKKKNGVGGRRKREKLKRPPAGALRDLPISRLPQRIAGNVAEAAAKDSPKTRSRAGGMGPATG